MIALRNPFRTDLVLVHPPSVLPGAPGPLLMGPINDVIPSASTFDMYPMGLTSLGETLEGAGYNVRIINAAARLLSDPGYQLGRAVGRMRPRLFGVDLHWLPHANGSLAVARQLKAVHPDVPLVMGGLSASYFHRELIGYPEVDFVLRGDSAEQPLLALMRVLERDTPLAEVPNLTWKRADGTVVVNELEHVPDSLDGVPVPSYRYAIRSAFKYGSLADVQPYGGWFKYPITALLTARGCLMGCSVCGGSRSAYSQICGRTRPAFRSPEALADDVRLIRRFSRGPIFVIHDLRMAGEAQSYRFLDLLARQRMQNELVVELFFPAGDEFFRRVAAASPRFSVQVTLESHDPDLRRRNGKFVASNEQVEETIAAAFRHGCQWLDLFFLIGLPGQTRASVLATAEYCEGLLQRFGTEGRLRFFAAPLAPFLDPGSRAFENPDAFGYRLIHRTLEEHRQALESPSWKYVLNYETDAMDRDTIVDATYGLAERLVRLKARHRLLSEAEAAQLSERIITSRRLSRAIDDALLLQNPERRAVVLESLRAAAQRVQGPMLCGKAEMRWAVRDHLFQGGSLLALGSALLGEELARMARRMILAR